MTGRLSYSIVVHIDDPLCVWIEVAEMPGCFAAGPTLEAAFECLGEAMMTWLADADTIPDDRLGRWLEEMGEEPFSFDPDARASYLRYTGKRVARTVDLGAVKVDVDQWGTVVGFEVLH